MKYRFISIVILLLPVFLFAQVKKIACVGNSITYGYGLSSPSTQSYPAQMQVMLGTANWEVGNFGVSGRTMLKKGDRPYWKESAFTNAKAFLPDEVMILLGTNDAKTYNWNPYGSQFESNYEEMIQIFRNLSSKPDIWIGLIPPGQHVAWTIYMGYVRDSVNTKIKQIAMETGVGLIDVFDAFNGNSANWYNPTYFQADSIHPNPTGAALLARTVKKMLLVPKPQLVYKNGKITVSTVAYGYQWYYNGSPVSKEDGGNDVEFTPTKTGKYKVSLKLNSNNETRIVSNEIDIAH